MKIKMLTTASGPAGSFKAGEVYEVGSSVPKVMAEAFLEGGFARKIEQKTFPELAEEIKSKWGPEIETEVQEPAFETAAVKSPRGKKK